jgi:hypothetical protein
MLISTHKCFLEKITSKEEAVNATRKISSTVRFLLHFIKGGGGGREGKG